MNKSTNFLLLFFVSFCLIFISCEKEDHDDHDHIVSNDAVEARLAYTKEGYQEIEVNYVEKVTCYFSKWDKEISVPVSGLFEYYDNSGVWIASIDFGDGTCDEWVTKTWNVDIFPQHPSGRSIFSVFNYKKSE